MTFEDIPIFKGLRLLLNPCIYFKIIVGEGEGGEEGEDSDDDDRTIREVTLEDIRR